MNTWRDIKEVPLNQAVFATDGDMVFFGRFAMTADRKCMFEGQDIEEACNYGIDPACLTGWQPAPDTWKPEKSADEMFAELGAERCPLIKNPFSGRRAYKRMDRYSEYRYEFTGDAVFAYVNGVQCGITIEEIPAIAQTLAELQQELMEMEADNG